VCAGLIGSPLGWCDMVHLNNGDRLSGSIREENAKRIILNHEVLGVLTIAPSQVKEITRSRSAAMAAAPKVPQPPAAAWKREISLGYNASGGNTEDRQLYGTAKASRKTNRDELTATGEGYYAASFDQMSAQRYGGLLRYAFSFGYRRAWYNFYKIEARHDRFADID